jgi:hypothetical protein
MARLDRLSLLAREPPPGFRLRVLIIAPMGTHPYRGTEWRDALVVIERGEVQLERLDGSLWTFTSGAVLWLAGLPLRALHNRREDVAVLAAVSRCRWTPMIFGAGSRPTIDNFETSQPRRPPG